MIIENKTLIDANDCLKNRSTNNVLHDNKCCDDEKCALIDKIKYLEVEKEEFRYLSCEIKIELNDLRDKNERIESYS